jgi:Zn-dependent protease
MAEVIFIIGQIVIILYSIILHEVAHGVVAFKLGDDTAARAGRLTLNPLSHIDPIGTIILPIFMALLPGGVIFGWAKPVPYNPYNLRNSSDELKVAFAGPATNLFIAALFAVAFRVIFRGGGYPMSILENLLIAGVSSNVLLAIFNLVPIPPLDGSKLLFLLIPKENYQLRAFLNQYGMVILLFFIFFGFNIIIPLINLIVKFLLGF